MCALNDKVEVNTKKKQLWDLPGHVVVMKLIRISIQPK